jgi:ribosomal protein S18 acetylase RimI-like enzyme
MISTRPVRADDVELVCRHRQQMFRESNSPGRTEEILETQTAHFRPWLTGHLGDGSYFGYIVEDHGKPVAGIEWPPGPSHPTLDKRGYVLNVFVEPSHRKQGIAKALMHRAEQEFAERGVALRDIARHQNGAAAVRANRLVGDKRDGKVAIVRRSKLTNCSGARS